MSIPVTCPAQLDSPEDEPSPQVTYYLENAPDAGGQVQRIALNLLPFRLGRCSSASFVIPCPEISREHAEIYEVDGELRIRDLNSTNGTFLNGHRIDDAALESGDILQFSHREFQIVSLPEEELDKPLTSRTHCGEEKLPSSMFNCRALLKELISQRFVKILFQPVLDLRTGHTLGYEALGRGTHEELSPQPYELFSLADRFGLAGRLSALLRTVAIEEACHLPGRPALFINVHPAELSDADFLDSLRDLREVLPSTQRLVVEIHEDTVAELAELTHIRQQLQEAGIMLAFDDFGTGQARLTELIDMPPDFIKLNLSLIRDIHRSAARQKLLRSIIHSAEDLGVQVLAEGIEVQDEAEVCRELGCRYGQGYLFGYPSPVLKHGEQETWQFGLDSSADSTQIEVLSFGTGR